MNQLQIIFDNFSRPIPEDFEGELGDILHEYDSISFVAGKSVMLQEDFFEAVAMLSKYNKTVASLEEQTNVWYCPACNVPMHLHSTSCGWDNALILLDPNEKGIPAIITGEQRRQRWLLYDKTSFEFDYHDGGKVNTHPQYIDGFNDGAKFKEEKKKEIMDNIHNRKKQIEREDKIHPSNQVAILRELERFKNWVIEL